MSTDVISVILVVSDYLLPDLANLCCEYLAAIDVHLLATGTTRNALLTLRAKIPPPLSYDEMSFTEADGIAARAILSGSALAISLDQYTKLPLELRPIIIAHTPTPLTVSDYLKLEFTANDYTAVIPYVISLGSDIGVAEIIRLGVMYKCDCIFNLVAASNTFNITVISTALMHHIDHTHFSVLISRLSQPNLELVLGELMMFPHGHHYGDLFIDRVNVNVQDKLGRTPLYRAILQGHYDNVIYLLQHGADPNIPASNKETPLIMAIRNFGGSCIPALLQYNFNLNNSGREEGMTPLDVAQHGKHHEWITALESRGAKSSLMN